MVKIIFFSLLSVAAWADDNVRQTPDTAWGHFEVSMTAAAERVFNPYFLSASVTCKDQRPGAHVLKPPTNEPLINLENEQGVHICAFLGHKLNADFTELTLHYMIEKDAKRPPKSSSQKNCMAGVEHEVPFDLKKICKVWGPDSPKP